MEIGLDPVLRSTLRAALSLLLLSAAAHKLRDVRAFAGALGAYDIVPSRLVRVTAGCLIAFEIAAAALLILSASWEGPALAAALVGLYTAAIGANLLRGRFDIDCGCSVGRGGQRLSWWLVGRNGGLLVAALLATLPQSVRPMIWIDAFTVAACTASLLLLYQGADTLLANVAGRAARLPLLDEAVDFPDVPIPPLAKGGQGGL
jgi:Methylamine utilisation protein MauE